MTTSLKRRHFTAGLALVPLAASGLLVGCSNIPDTIKIGVAQPLSGPLAALGQDLLNGVNLAVSELNKNNFSIDGKRVTLEVVAVDDRADSATGKTVAQQLVDAGVVAVRPTLTLRYTFDERVEDGLYCAHSLELLRTRIEQLAGC